VPSTLRDVARVAGVSPSTVSRALANPDMVRTATRELVQRAADRLGYQPNRAARGLITGRTGNIGVIVPDLANPFFPHVLKGIQARARDAEYAVFLADSDEDPAAEVDLVRALSKQVDGLILCSPRMRDHDIADVASETVTVLVNRRVGRTPAITTDYADGMRQALAHLEALGHRHIAWVGGPRMSWSNRERVRGLRTSSAAADLVCTEMGHFPPTFAGGVAAADLVVASEATAVIAYNDLVALGILSRLTARGISVPERLSIVGIDDIPMSEMSHPALTTVGLPKEAAGRAAFDLMHSLLSQPDALNAARRELPVQLIVRGSTGVARPPPSH
jgi:LacI family transcriptional regulator